jgi:hypothetical protein
MKDRNIVKLDRPVEEAERVLLESSTWNPPDSSQARGAYRIDGQGLRPNGTRVVKSDARI